MTATRYSSRVTVCEVFSVESCGRFLMCVTSQLLTPTNTVLLRWDYYHQGTSCDRDISAHLSLAMWRISDIIDTIHCCCFCHKHENTFAAR